MKNVLILAALLLTATIGCSKKTSTEPLAEPTAAEYLASGWSSFNAGNDTTAQSSFNSAIAKDASLADAYNGKGWCQGILGDPAAALVTFKDGQARSGTSGILNEIKAGMAFSYAALGKPDSAIINGSAVLVANNLWSFSHTYRPSQDNTLNYLEVCLLLAQSHFKLGQFTQAEDYVQLLHPGFDVDEGTTAGQAALQVEIERLAGTM